MGMEISLGDWEAEWSTGEPFDVYGGGYGGVAAASTSQVEDQLLLDGLVGQHITLVDYGLIMPRARSPSLDCLATETNSADSASLCQPHWSATPATVSGMRPQPDYKSNSNASTILMRKRKRDPDPEHFTLIGSGSGHPAATSGNPFRLIIRESPKPALINCNGTISFQQGVEEAEGAEPDAEAIQQMKEMIYRAAAFRPVNLGVEAAERPRRKNVRISTDPQTVAARQRRERISERLRVLQKLVPGGSKMDTASMLDEAANYLKFLRSQVHALEAMASTAPSSSNGALPPVCFNFSNSFPNYRLNMQSHQISPPTCNNVNPLLLLHQYAKG